ncbi:DNA damage-regulated autophagy modulator protein 1-like [Phyllobates terribilis]|uniref:DNA damage-regulated autophagy modulator protein 1-like n=1 Tax=Phyllobates terribilis TaxID=111132 RepID=UPI003CCAEC1E
MEIRGLALLPILWILWTLLGLCVLAALTIISGHNKYPYISHTGKQYPESVIYTVIFMVNSILGAGIAYIQYRFMIIQSEPSEKRYIICQKILLIVGWIVCIGTAVNAVYSMKTNPTAHRIGAGMAFFLLAMYNLCQSVYLYKRSFSSRWIFYMTGMIAEWTGLVGLVMHQLTNYTDFQSLSLKISREGVTICLREKNQAFKMPV